MHRSPSRFAFLLLFFLLVAHRSLSQGTPASIDSFFRIRFPNQLNGGVLLAAGQKTIYRQAFGMSDFDRSQVNTPSTPFNLASVSKVITSTAVLQLAEKGRLRLSDPVQNYLPSFPYPGITIRHLLTHTSGLPDLELYEDIAKQFPDSILDNRAILPALRQWGKPLYFAPGEKWRYNNTNYDLLAVLIEKVSGLSYAAYLKRFIFQPAGMAASFVASPTVKGVTAWVRPLWYSDQYIPADSLPRYHYINYNLSGLVGSTGIVTTTEDLLRFDAAVFSHKLISAASLAMATTPTRLNDGSTFYENSMDTMLGEGKGSYGMGWSLYELPALGKAVGHGGFNYGLYTFYFHRLQPAQTVVAFDNTASPSFARMVTSAALLLGGQNAIAKPARRSLARTYGIALRENGADAAMVQLNRLRTDSLNYYLDEREMNWLGYDLLRASFDGHLALALEAFKINCLLFPESFNVYDSYGESLVQAGKKELAILMYQKSLSINPNNKGAAHALESLK